MEIPGGASVAGAANINKKGEELLLACRPAPKVFGDFALFKALFTIGIIFSLDLSISH